MRQISTVSFLEDGSVVIVYMDPSCDVRNRGLVIQSHQVHIARGQEGKDYGDEIDDVDDAVKRLLDDALEDWHTTEAVQPGSPATSDDANVR